MASCGNFLKVSVLAILAGGHALAFEPALPNPDPNASGVAASAPEDQASVAIARRVVDAAGAFERYIRQAVALTPQFDGAASVSTALMTGAAYDPVKLDEGAIAYGALAALQEPTFVEALGSYGRGSGERLALAQRLTESPELVLEFPGAQKAASRAAGALHRMGSDLVARGRSVKAAAYTIQREPWSQLAVAEAEERLARVKAQGAGASALTEAETQALLAQLVANRQDFADAAAGTSATPAIVRAVALAAVAMLGHADEDRADALTPLLSDRSSGDCLRRAKLNLNQCIAAAGPQYEDVYCTGVHAMAETGQCLVKTSGGSVAGGVKVPVANQSRSPRSVAVPVARLSESDTAPQRPAEE